MLPIEAVLDDLRAALRARSEAVLVAPPGAGKTTRTPLALLDEPWVAGRRLVLLSPRRIAARAAAARMAASLGERVGETVGYRVRLDAKASARTRIEVVTEGVFTRRILNQPDLPDVAAVLFDEFHERSLEGDLGLALARDAQTGLRPDLRLLVMSATLDAARIAALLGDAPIVESQGRLFPVEARYRPRDPHARIEDEAAAAVRGAHTGEAGSILVFLPGAREIERVASLLRETLHDPDTDVRPLYGALSPAEQDAAIAPPPEGRRKIVLATAIAETSLTIEGVRVVIDSGLARRARYEPGLGLTRLETVRASRAAVEQRRGRAGRLEPGVCVRLWAEGETRALPPFDRPEILDADLSGLALDLAAWGVRDPASLAWLDPPPAAAWREAQALLALIGALDGDGRLTPHGAALSRLPLPPRLAHMVLAAPANERALAARIAVLLTEQGLGGRDADLSIRLSRAEQDQGARATAARTLAARIARDAQAQGDADAASAGALLARAYPDRVAKARARGGGEFVLANGRGARLPQTEALAREDFVVVAELAGAADRAQILLAAPIAAADVERLFARQIESRDEAILDPDTRRVRARRVRRLGRIVLRETPLESPSAEDRARAIVEAVSQTGLSLLPWSESDRQLRARVALMRSLEGEAWPDWSDDALAARLDDWLAPAIDGARDLDALGDGRLGRALEQQLDFAQRRALAEAAPARFETPAGGSALIDYAAENGPAVDVRLQEVFGMREHPSVARGRAPLLLRLLSPAQRPIQVTRDLPGFWRGSYAEVRIQMRGRYPKHPWPEDPLAAQPTRRAKPRT
ncbi:MAG: ATP-dependent helicase HrpB [Hydrogenophilaceae bacterium]|jgi:ATP-dependent helicase HrpB|nr:ATP-dependent helicase HrpB [Hydrogenophilaceae bacterium]